MKRILVAVLVLSALLTSCGNSQSQNLPTIQEVSERVTAVEDARVEDAARITELEVQVEMLVPKADEIAESASCGNVPTSLTRVDLDEFGTVKVPYFDTERDYVIRLHPVQIAQIDDDGLYEGWSTEQFLQNPIWFIVFDRSKSIWLTGQSVDTTKGDAPAALIFPVFANQHKFSLDLQVGDKAVIYQTYSSKGLSDTVAWIISCDTEKERISFFGGQYLLPSQFAEIHKQVPSLQPNK